MGISDKIIIKTIREMYLQKVSDSRDLFNQNKDEFKQFIGNEFNNDMLIDAISINWISINQLKKFSNSYIMGGGKNECLKEIQLIMNSFNISYKEISSLIY